MGPPRAAAERDSGARLSIGALSKATGIPVETLRTWETRYGFPAPERKPSGHRLYPVDFVPRLRRVAEALARGLRAGQVVAASEVELDQLLATTLTPLRAQGAPGGRQPGETGVDDLLDCVRRLDGDGLSRQLVSDWARLGPLGFVEGRVSPLLTAVGEAWERGDLDVGHEHFASQRISDMLRSVRMPLEERASGPLAVLATLPGEQHGLGLEMAALVLTAAGWRLLHLGTDCPLADMASLTRDLGARALALSLAAGARGPGSAAQLRRLRGMLPRRTRLVVGGAGAPRSLEGADLMGSLAELDRWARNLAAA